MTALVHILRLLAFRWLPRIGLLAFLAGNAAALFASWSVNSRRKRDDFDAYAITPFELQTPYRKIRFRSEDIPGLELSGWVFEQPESKSLLVGFTGRRVAKDSLIGIGTGLWRAGHSVLVFDFRGRGESAEGPQSIGHHEMADARAALAFAKREYPDKQVGIFGYSMGANMALRLAAADSKIVAVMADSPFTDLNDILSGIFNSALGRVLGAKFADLPVRALVRLTDFWNERLYGYRFAQGSAREAVQRIAPRPLLLIHGTEDSVTPLPMARRLFADYAASASAASRAASELWIEPNTEHCGVYFVDRERYIERVARFFHEAYRVRGVNLPDDPASADAGAPPARELFV